MQYSYALGACKPQVKVTTKQTKTISVRLIDFPLIILQITKTTTCFVKPDYQTIANGIGDPPIVRYSSVLYRDTGTP